MTAYTDLQAALGEAVTGDQIWIATGVYTPGISRSDTFNVGCRCRRSTAASTLRRVPTSSVNAIGVHIPPS